MEATELLSIGWVLFGVEIIHRHRQMWLEGLLRRVTGNDTVCRTVIVIFIVFKRLKI